VSRGYRKHRHGSTNGSQFGCSCTRNPLLLLLLLLVVAVSFWCECTESCEAFGGSLKGSSLWRRRKGKVLHLNKQTGKGKFFCTCVCVCATA